MWETILRPRPLLNNLTYICCTKRFCGQNQTKDQEHFSPIFSTFLSGNWANLNEIFFKTLFPKPLSFLFLTILTVIPDTLGTISLCSPPQLMMLLLSSSIFLSRFPLWSVTEIHQLGSYFLLLFLLLVGRGNGGVWECGNSNRLFCF